MDFGSWSIATGGFFVSMSDYQQFLAMKRVADVPTGLDQIGDLNGNLYPFQRDIVHWALKRGRAAIFADCGLGKTLMQMEWARHIPGRVLIVAPLAVATQTVRESGKFGIDGAKYLREDDKETRLAVTNYEMLARFSPEDFTGIVLDESSILKSYTGKFRNQLVDDWGGVPFRLCATATPAPNDFMELGNHSEFLGCMSRTEMLARFFVHDGGETQKWRLKGHAKTDFWKWMASWSLMIRKPSDIGYDNGSFELPPLFIDHVQVDHQPDAGEMLFALDARTLQERQEARRNSVDERVKAVADLVNGSDEPWLVWCDLNSESDALRKAIGDAVEVRGSDTPESKEDRMMGFVEGRYRVLVSKPSICGWGMNFQHCSKIAFTGLSDSYEQFYQAVRRCWRFGQLSPVTCYVVTANTEGAVVENIKRKEADAEEMANRMLEQMQNFTLENIKGSQRIDKTYKANQSMVIPSFLL